MLGRKAMSGVRDLRRGGNLLYHATSWVTQKPTVESFAIDAVLADACALAGIAAPSNPEEQIPDYKWWKKLCKACGEKPTTSYGGALLRGRLLNGLSQRLAIDEIFRLNGTEIEAERIEQPLIVMGLPRSTGHLAAHVLSRSGLFLSFRQCDTFAPSLLSEMEREDAFKHKFRGFTRVNSDFLCVRVLNGSQIDDDLTLHLMTPQSYAWGLLHGLDEYLLDTLAEDQTPVYAQVKRTMQLFQWYKRCGHFSETVAREFEPIDNAMEIQTYGTKNKLAGSHWLLFSPFAILTSDAINAVFPHMRAIWVHRALAQCIPSLCSSLSLHNSLYTGKPPTDTQLASMGEKVLGIFGSGTEYAIDYYGDFDQRRMAHWSNRDVKRHASRIARKTLDYFGIELDRFRRIQVINGQTEYLESFRPLHDSQMPYFCLHDGVIDQVFSSYVHQFGEFAFEKKFGVEVKEYKPLTQTNDQFAIGASQRTGKSGASAMGVGQPMPGHLLQEGKGFKW